MIYYSLLPLFRFSTASVFNFGKCSETVRHVRCGGVEMETIARKNTCTHSWKWRRRRQNWKIYYKTENTIYKRHYIDSFISLTFQMLYLFLSSLLGIQRSVFILFIYLFVCLLFGSNKFHCRNYSLLENSCETEIVCMIYVGFCRASDYTQCIVRSHQECHFLVSRAFNGRKYFTGARTYFSRITNKNDDGCNHTINFKHFQIIMNAHCRQLVIVNLRGKFTELAIPTFNEIAFFWSIYLLGAFLSKKIISNVNSGPPN